MVLGKRREALRNGRFGLLARVRDRAILTALRCWLIVASGIGY
jgi:hypothetical protein